MSDRPLSGGARAAAPFFCAEFQPGCAYIGTAGNTDQRGCRDMGERRSTLEERLRGWGRAVRRLAGLEARPAGLTLGAGLALGMVPVGMLLGVSLSDAEGPVATAAGAMPVVTLPPAAQPASIGDDAKAPADEVRRSRQRLPAWQRFAVAVPETGERPLIAIVIDDIGMDRLRSLRAMALEAPLTMAMLPYAPDIERQARMARVAGHEVLVHLPLEPHRPSADPGPNHLAMDQDAAELQALLRWNLSQLGGYVGISNHMGSRFTEDPRRMRWLMSEVRARGLLFLDSLTSNASAGRRAAELTGVPFAERDVFLDNEQSAGEVRFRLSELEAAARRQGFAVGIGHPHDATIDVLRRWLPEARRRGFAIVPISAVVRHRIELAENAPGRR